MTPLSTKRCSEVGHSNFRLLYDPKRVLDSDAAWFAQSLEEMVLRGERFAAGQSFQIGWSFTLLEVESDGHLGFLEPDFNAMPVKWQKGITHSLRHLRLHKDVVESVLPKEQIRVPSLRQSCIVCTELPTAQRLLMARGAEAGDDSGWFIGCDGAGHDHSKADSLGKVSLYEAIVSQSPKALPYLALPPGVSVLIADGRPRVLRDDRELQIKPGSYLAAAVNGVG